MKKGMKQSRLELRENYDNACNAYLKAFCEKHDFEYDPREWIAGDPGGTACVGDFYVGMSDILTDIDRDAPEDEYVKYYDYCLRVGSIAGGELTTPNYDSWLRGCPRISDEQLQQLEEYQSGIRDAEALLKAEINKLNNSKQV